MTPQSAKKLTSSRKSCWQLRRFQTVSGSARSFTPPAAPLYVFPPSFNLARTFSLVALLLLLLLLPPSCSSLHSKVDKSERRSRGVAAVFRLRLYNNAHGSWTAHSFISRRAAAAAAPRVWVTLCFRFLLFLSPPLLLDFLLFTPLRRGQTDCGARRVSFPYLKCHPSSCVTPQGGRRSESDSSLLLVAQ